MANVIGFNNLKEKEHCFGNTLDGNLSLRIYVDFAKGNTIVYVNGSETCYKDAGDGKRPFYCGEISIPRGEFTLAVQSQCEISKIIMVEEGDIQTIEEFELMYANRSGQQNFFREKMEYTPEHLKQLQRHGFLYDEAEDCAVGKMPSGVPLGGMGCGKLEICEDGMFTAFTGNNNQDCPIYRMPGSFLALACGDKVRIFRKNAMELPYQSMETIEAQLEFPVAKLTCTDSELPISAQVEAFSPHIPGNAADSALPCVFFEVKLHNDSLEDTDMAFCFSWENLINVGGSMSVTNKGERLLPPCYHTWNCSFPWSDRRKNNCIKRENSLIFGADDDRGNPMSFGNHVLYCSEQDAEYVCDRSILPEDEKKFVAWLSGKGEKQEGSEAEFRAGAYVVRRRLKAGEFQVIRFVLAWYMPVLLDVEGFDHGVEYTNRFANAEEVLEYAVLNRERLYTETIAFNNMIHRSTLPEWFKSRLLDDRFVVTTCSWYDRAGNFSINEAPTGMGGCLGTLDQRTASQVYYTTFFPDLDERELELFRQSQAEDGMCAHEIGFATIKLWARPFSKWSDLVAAYIIQVYHHYQRTGNEEMLRLHWPHIKKAVEWTLTMDDIRCGIPYVCSGRGCTYDNQFWPGINAFITTMQIAAYRIGSACARVVGETDTAQEWESLLNKAQAYRMEHLWNPEAKYFYNAYNPNTKETDDSCFISAMAGEWAAVRAGLRTELSMEQISDVADAIVKQCVGEYGLSDQGGRKDKTPGFIQYPLAYLASPAIYSGNLEAAWHLALMTDKIITRPGISTRFNQALTYLYDGTRFGLPYYMTAPASWNMLEALAGLVCDRNAGYIKISPGEVSGIRLPVFLTNVWFEIVGSENGEEIQLVPVYSKKSRKFHTLCITGKWFIDGVNSTYSNGATTFSFPYDPGQQNIILKRV